MLVAFAVTEFNPSQISVGKESSVPPPATELIAPAKNADPNAAAAVKTLKFAKNQCSAQHFCTHLPWKCISGRMSFQPADLQAHRIARGVSLQQIAQMTMIGARYLEAIERGAFDKLPGGVYTTSYIRKYARAAGCDEVALRYSPKRLEGNR